ncbi:MAG TPA: phosphoglucosamine mutase, partial [Thermoplasmatales archaeon]|nr:phosphoglucosamine mutase [Thermoplasmatales archaeon]
AMTIAKVLEILSKEGKRLSEIIQELPRYELVKLKTACPNEKKKEVLEKIKDIAKNENARKIDETDGVKIYTDDGWVLVRPSGTEPIFRIFAESKERKRAEELANRYKGYVERFATGTS